MTEQSAPPVSPPVNPTTPTDPVAAAPESPKDEGSLLDTPEEPKAPEAPAVEPLTWDKVTLPEGFDLPDEEIQNSFLSVMNDSAMTPAERAEKTIGLHTKLMENVATQMDAAWKETQEDWKSQVRKDPEIGGDKLEPALAEVAKLINRYGGQDLRDAMRVTGAGNHPAMIRFLHKIAKETNEAPPISGTPSQAPQDRATRMYGTQT